MKGVNKPISSEAKTLTGKLSLYQGLRIGFTVFAILLAVADIVMTTITLYKYYNRDHIPIPHHMVDVSYNEDAETSFLAYKSVPDQNGDYGDLNGGGGKQWLAIYESHDEDAGDPILAPNDSQYQIQVKTGKGSEKTPDNCSPLHLFGQPNAPQNLTFSDGEKGWSFNDKMDGIYLFFTRDPEPFYGDAEDAYTGTSMSGGYTALGAVIGVIVGLIVGAGGAVLNLRRRKREETNG